MINNLRFELSFKNFAQLENKIKFCELNKLNNINIPCKGTIKKEFLNTTVEYLNKNHREFNIVYHYSLYHQYARNKENSYQKFLDFIKLCSLSKDNSILLVSGSQKRKNFDVVNLLSCLKYEKNLQIKLGVAYNPYLQKYFNISFEKERYLQKVSSGFINSTWLQFGTDIDILQNEVRNIKNPKNQKIDLFGSLLIPSKQFIARFKYRPWKEVYISKKYLNSIENFNAFTRDLIDFYLQNNITPVIETDFFSPEKLNSLYSFFN